MRIVARIAVLVVAAIAYSFAFLVAGVVVLALTHHDSRTESTTTSTNGSITLVVESDPLPTWVTSVYFAGLAGVVFLVFMLRRRSS
jgi:hypothetical protein